MPITARAQTAIVVPVLPFKPVLTAVQLVSLSDKRKTPPPSIPAKRYVLLSAKDSTIVFAYPVNPAFISVQVVPLLVERKTPPPEVPARSSVPINVSAET